MPGVCCRANMEVMCMLMSYASACRRNLIAQQATLPACIILPDTGVKLVLPLDYIHNRDFEVTEGNVVLALEMSQRCECFCRLELRNPLSCWDMPSLSIQSCRHLP